MSDDEPKPRVIFTAHGRQRVEERVRPIFPANRDPHKFVTAMVYGAIAENSFTRKPPWWCRARKIPKGNHIRFVKTAFGDEPIVIVVGRKDHNVCVVITVITRGYATQAAVA